MSWWDTDNDDDVIGDQPADLNRQSLQQMVTTRAHRGEGKPTLAELLRAIGNAAATAGKELLDNVPTELSEITAVLKSGETISSGPLEEDPKISDLVSILTENLHAIHDVYQERWERKPRLSEWLYAFAFVLLYQPEDFLSDGVDHPPSRIEVGRS
jgi:hypothetical protein